MWFLLGGDNVRVNKQRRFTAFSVVVALVFGGFTRCLLQKGAAEIYLIAKLRVVSLFTWRHAFYLIYT